MFRILFRAVLATAKVPDLCGHLVLIPPSIGAQTCNNTGLAPSREHTTGFEHLPSMGQPLHSHSMKSVYCLLPIRMPSCTATKQSRNTGSARSFGVTSCSLPAELTSIVSCLCCTWRIHRLRLLSWVCSEDENSRLDGSWPPDIQPACSIMSVYGQTFKRLT